MRDSPPIQPAAAAAAAPAAGVPAARRRPRLDGQDGGDVGARPLLLPRKDLRQEEAFFVAPSPRRNRNKSNEQEVEPTDGSQTEDDQKSISPEKEEVPDFPVKEPGGQDNYESINVVNQFDETNSEGDEDYEEECGATSNEGKTISSAFSLSIPLFHCLRSEKCHQARISQTLADFISIYSRFKFHNSSASFANY